MEIKDLIDGHNFMGEEEVINHLRQVRDRQNRLGGFLKGLMYHKDKNINCNWEYDLNFLSGMIDKLLEEAEGSQKQSKENKDV